MSVVGGGYGVQQQKRVLWQADSPCWQLTAHLYV